MNKNDYQIGTNVIWHFAEKWGCQIVSSIITVIIARLLIPKTYGVVAIINTFMQIFTVFIDAGLGNSLIQKKNPDELDYSTVFVSNIILCLFIYLILFVSAPYIAEYYEIESLSLLLRVSSLSIVISSIKNIQHAYVSKQLMFKKFFFSSLLGTIGAGIIGIAMAFKGYGAWALVISNLFDVLIDTIVLGFTIKWIPTLQFSFDRFRNLFNFGWKILVSSFIERLFNKSYHLIIGKYCSSTELAYYDKGNGLTSKVSDNIDNVLNSVLFPVMSNNQNDINEVKQISKKVLKVNTFIMFPILFGIIATCRQIVIVLLTKNWIESVPYIDIFCLINVLLPLNTINLNIIKSLGKSDLYLKQETYKKIIAIILLIVSFKFGSLAILISKLLSTVFSVIINSYPNKKLVNYGILEQIKDIFPNLLSSIIMCAIVYCIRFLNLNALITLILQVLTGVIIYFAIAVITKNEAMYYVFDLIRNWKNEK